MSFQCAPTIQTLGWKSLSCFGLLRRGYAVHKSRCGRKSLRQLPLLLHKVKSWPQPLRPLPRLLWVQPVQLEIRWNSNVHYTLALCLALCLCSGWLPLSDFAMHSRWQEKIMHRKCKQCKIHVKQNGLTTRLVRRPQGCNWYTYPAFRLNDALRASRLLMLSFAGCWTAKTSSKGNGYRLIMVAWVQCGDQWGC